MSEIRLHRCDRNDVSDILRLQDEVIAALPDPTVLRKNSEEMFISCTSAPNLSLALYDQNEMIALIIFVDARGTDEDLGIGLERFHVDINGNFKLILVHPDYRGNHYMALLMKILERYAVQQGYTDLCVTVAPDNSYSLNNILNAGYLIDHYAIKYGGNPRYVCVKRLYSDQELLTDFEDNFSAFLEKNKI